MFQSFVFVILLNSFHFVEVKPIYSINESTKKLPTTTTTTPIVMVKIKPSGLDINQTSKRCKVVILPKLNWRTPFSLAKSGHKFQHVRLCKPTTITTPVAATTTAATTASTETLTATSVPRTKTSMTLLLKEVKILTPFCLSDMCCSFLC